MVERHQVCRLLFAERVSSRASPPPLTPLPYSLREWGRGTGRIAKENLFVSRR